MRKTLGTTVALCVLFSVSAATAQDFDEYAQLVERAESAYDLLEGAPEHRQGALAETALDADLAVIGWLDEFLATDAFGELPEDQQALVVRNRYRWEYNAAALLTRLDRCEEARDRVRALLDRPMNDAELRPRLTEAYDDAIACVNRPRHAILVVEGSPVEAEVFVDGALAGLMGAEIEVGLGEHTVLVRADGYATEELTINPAEEGERVELGPLNLLPIAAPEVNRSPTWYEWTLWGAGVAGVTVGVVYLVEANNREDQVENPPTGFEVADPEKEQQTIDDLRMVSYIAGSIGLVSLIAGTISYAVRDKEPEMPPAGTASVGLGLGRVWLDVTF